MAHETGRTNRESFKLRAVTAGDAVTLQEEMQEGTMRLPRRGFLHLAAAAAALPCAPSLALAEAYPARPVRIIVGFGPGGVADILARLMGQWLSERLGRPFVIENRPGAGSNIATEAVAHSPPDGCTLLLISGANAYNASLYENLTFNFVRDIAPVAAIATGPSVMEVKASFPAKTVPEFIAYAKANPGKINSSGGRRRRDPALQRNVQDHGRRRHGGRVLPWSGPAMTDLLGGQVQVMFDPLVSSIEHIRGGEFRALAVTGATRSAALPEIPTVAESVPGYEAAGWEGIGVPRNTPAEIIDTLNRRSMRALPIPG